MLNDEYNVTLQEKPDGSKLHTAIAKDSDDLIKGTRNRVYDLVTSGVITSSADLLTYMTSIGANYVVHSIGATITAPMQADLNEDEILDLMIGAMKQVINKVCNDYRRDAAAFAALNAASGEGEPVN